MQLCTDSSARVADTGEVELGRAAVGVIADQEVLHR